MEVVQLGVLVLQDESDDICLLGLTNLSDSLNADIIDAAQDHARFILAFKI